MFLDNGAGVELASFNEKTMTLGDTVLSEMLIAFSD